ncbi:MAG: F0F1 ATP synthase subunit delta, partial [Pseudomonadota bacterium]
RFKRKINPQVSIDRELIGGVRVVVGDEVIDGSVRGKLTAMSTPCSVKARGRYEENLSFREMRLS